MSLSAFDPAIWIAAAALLGALEIALPGYLLLGFSASALVAAAAVALAGERIAGAPNGLLWLLIAWSALALAIWLALARRFGRPARVRRRAERDVNDFDHSD